MEKCDLVDDVKEIKSDVKEIHKIITQNKIDIAILKTKVAFYGVGGAGVFSLIEHMVDTINTK